MLTGRPDYTVELKGQIFVYSLALIAIFPGVKLISFSFQRWFLSVRSGDFGGNLGIMFVLV